MINKDEDYVKIVPHKRQLIHQQMEFYAFFHFSVNTFTGREWGDGSEPQEIFNPVKMDATQWVTSIKKAGMRGAILTCKHHDGFCLWPSKFTKYTIANSPYKNGNGDIVREVSEALKAQGLKFGVYLSPWDRNNKSYGLGQEYDDFYIGQLTELLTEYGEIFSVWLDGACGEGVEGKVQEYNWERYYKCIRQLQPMACISVCGPDVRWCGNEAGETREAEWSVVPRELCEAERIQNASQKEDTQTFREKKLSSAEQDLGSRKALEEVRDLIWYPAEVNTSIRPGWFYHKEEDDKVKTLKELLDIYYHSVGGNSTFLLNIPPTPEGLVHENDEKRLEEIGEHLKKTFSDNRIKQARLTADTCKAGCSIKAVCVDDNQTWYQPKGTYSTARIIIDFPTSEHIQYIVIKEHIMFSQRIESFAIYAGELDNLKCVYEGKTIGYKKIIPITGVTCSRIELCITDARVSPMLSFIGIYK